jgi:flagellar basal-body rod modification protein FlgD
MTTIQNTTATGASGAAAAALSPVATAATAGDIQDRFLKLLVTQLKNQDPLNPMDNAQLTSQLAQISTVNGIQQLNTTMQSLSSSLLSSQSMQSAGLIGRVVLTDGNSVAYDGTNPGIGGAQLAQSADSVKVAIKGPSGNVVRQIDLGAQGSGFVPFQWDGLDDGGATVAAGIYSFAVTASRGGQPITATPVAAGAVQSVSFGSGGQSLNVKGIGDIQMQQIKSIM